MTTTVTIRGVTYPSQKAAAEASGVSVQAVSSARQRGTLDRVGLGPLRAGCPPVFQKPITVQGHTFPSRTAAAEALGIPRSYLSSYVAVVEAIDNYARRIKE